MMIQLLIAGGVAAGVFFATRGKSDAPDPGAVKAASADIRARQTDGTGVQADQAGAPVTSATPIARPSTTVLTAAAPTSQTRTGGASIPVSTRTVSSIRFTTPPPAPIGTSASDGQKTAIALIQSGVGGDIRF